MSSYSPVEAQQALIDFAAQGLHDANATRYLSGMVTSHVCTCGTDVNIDIFFFQIPDRYRAGSLTVRPSLDFRR